VQTTAPATLADSTERDFMPYDSDYFIQRSIACHVPRRSMCAGQALR